MTRNVEAIFADIDTLDSRKFVPHLTEDAVFQFGNSEPVVPNADILTFEGDKVKDWRIFNDLTPVYA
jgi:hypothetical protein